MQQQFLFAVIVLALAYVASWSTADARQPQLSPKVAVVLNASLLSPDMYEVRMEVRDIDDSNFSFTPNFVAVSGETTTLNLIGPDDLKMYIEVKIDGAHQTVEYQAIYEHAGRILAAQRLSFALGT